MEGQWPCVQGQREVCRGADGGVWRGRGWCVEEQGEVCGQARMVCRRARGVVLRGGGRCVEGQWEVCRAIEGLYLPYPIPLPQAK